MKTLSDFNKFDQASISEICEVKGIGAAKAAQIKAALEIGKHMASQALGVKIKLQTARDFVEEFAPFMKNLRKETVKVVLLDPKLKLLKELTISKGV